MVTRGHQKREQDLGVNGGGTGVSEASRGEREEESM